MIYIFMNVCWYKYDTKKVVETLFHNLNKRGKGTNPSGNELKSHHPYFGCSCLLPQSKIRLE